MLSLPLSLLQAFDQSELLECIRRLVEIDQDWVPQSDSASVYIRPTFISTEVRWIYSGSALLFGLGTAIKFVRLCVSHCSHLWV